MMKRSQIVILLLLFSVVATSFLVRAGDTQSSLEAAVQEAAETIKKEAEDVQQVAEGAWNKTSQGAVDTFDKVLEQVNQAFNSTNGASHNMAVIACTIAIFAANAFVQD